LTKTIKILDCTLRDGGYCNNWEFDYESIKYIISHLSLAGIDIVECGYLSDSISEKQRSIFDNVLAVNKILKDVDVMQHTKFALMINHSEYDVNKLPSASDVAIDVIRYAYHKKDYAEAIERCRLIKEKGYDVYLQPMVTNSYSLNDLERMLGLANDLQPAAVYVVDSFGSLAQEDLQRLITVYKKLLRQNIIIGLHTHNNLQLAFSNSITFVREQCDRDLIVDLTVMGIGRGAGNLNAELFLDWLNHNQRKEVYDLREILKIADSVISSVLEKKQWGYSLANYLSAKHNCHPNYSNYLLEKRTLLYEDIDSLFESMPESKKYSFDKDYIESLYVQYMTNKSNALKDHEANTSIFAGCEVLIIGSGKSAWKEKKKILEVIENNSVVCISINFDYPYYQTDYVFISNLRRYKQIDKKILPRAIVTSNIPAESCYKTLDYQKYLCDIDYVHDNAMVMLINFLISCGIKKLYVAGVDGYSYSQNNYMIENMDFVMSPEMCEHINSGLKMFINEKKKEVELTVVTDGVLKGDQL